MRGQRGQSRRRVQYEPPIHHIPIPLAHSDCLDFTGHLDRVASLLQSRGWAALRIDGAVPTAQRQPLVDRFNAAWDSSLVMLLSARAGGAGINLIGANRLVMLDPDWNPSVDAQAMARVWRQGQRKPVAIYRLFSAATVEETIFRVRTVAHTCRCLCSHRPRCHA